MEHHVSLCIGETFGCSCLQSDSKTYMRFLANKIHDSDLRYSDYLCRVDFAL